MKRIFGLIVCLVSSLFGFSQNPPFWNDIQKFKAEDSANAPQKKAIVFTGSSSFTLWKDVQQRFPDHKVINRGFGGSSLPDVIRYADDVIFKYKPKQVVIYCGENDAAADSAISGDTIANRFITLFNMIRTKLPKASIAYVSMKPSPSRVKFRTAVVEGNRLIKAFIESKKNAAYIDVYSKMLDANGNPIGSLFLQDSLHMNSTGYDIWQTEIRPYLKK